MAILLQETNFNSVAIKNWHKAFHSECPEGNQGGDTTKAMWDASYTHLGDSLNNIVLIHLSLSNGVIEYFPLKNFKF